MKLVKRKTRKAIRKSVKKAINEHGPGIAAAVVSGVASTLATLAGTEAPGKGGKSNLRELSDNVTAAVSGDDEPDRDAALRKKHVRKGDGSGRDPRLAAEEGEPLG